MRRFIALIFFVFVLSEIFGQRPSIEFTFTAIDSVEWVRLDSIRVINRSRDNVDTLLFYPDTVLILDCSVGFPEYEKPTSNFGFIKNYPNPVRDWSTLSMNIPDAGDVNLMVTDALGREVLHVKQYLSAGIHSFRFIPGNQSLYLISARWDKFTESVKVFNSSAISGRACRLEHLGSEEPNVVLKSSGRKRGFSFDIGDELFLIGYAHGITPSQSFVSESGIMDFPDTSQTFTFQFATNIPCPGMPTVTYENQVYNTVQIFSQCWLKDNLNVGSQIDGAFDQHDNGFIQKYCYEDSEDSCTKYGGLYQWDEMMQYTTSPRAQGICPAGWHIPDDEEWILFEGATDSEYLIGDKEYNKTGGYRGFDAGENIKSGFGWFPKNEDGNGIDFFGMKVLPGGQRKDIDHSFDSSIYEAFIWTSTEAAYNRSYYRVCTYWAYQIFKDCIRWDNKFYGFSVRCLKDY